MICSIIYSIWNSNSITKIPISRIIAPNLNEKLIKGNIRKMFWFA